MKSGTIRRKCLPILVEALLILVLCSQGHAQTIEQVQPQTGKKTDLKQFPLNVGKDFLALFSRNHVLLLLIGGAATGISSKADDNVHDYFSVRDTDRPLGNIGDTLGQPVVLVPAVGTILVLGGLSKNKKLYSFSYELAEGLVLDSALTTGLKYAVRRERPDNTNKDSFPSGHTSDYFMIAATVDHVYGHVPGALMFGLASYVGASRLVKDRHWVSDVVAGAALGTIVERTVSRRTEKRSLSKYNWAPFGSIKRKEIGIRLAIRFQ